MNIKLELPVTQPATLELPPQVELPQPTKRGRKPKADAPSNPTTPPAVDPKAALLAELNAAIDSLNAQRGALGAALKEFQSRSAVLTAVTKKLVDSKLFTSEEIVEAVKSKATAVGLGEKSISAILVRAGLRQRAPRSDKGQPRGDNAQPPAATAPTTPTLPTTPEALATAITAAFGGDKSKAALFIGAAYTALKLG